MSFIAWTAAIPIMIVLCLWPSSTRSQELAVPGQTPPTEIQEIELIHAGDHAVLKIIVRGRQPANSFTLSSYRPSDPHLALFVQTGTSVGGCRAQQKRVVPPLRVRVAREGTSPCELVWSLRTANNSLDALSFQTLRVRGSTSSPLLITLVAESADQRQSTAEVGRVADRFDVDFPLAPIARQLDLRRLTQVTLLAENDADVVLEECAWMNQEPAILLIPSVDFWYWDYPTDVEELATISGDTLRYVRLESLLVWLAMETTRLLPERHVILKHEDDPALADGILDPVRRKLTLGHLPAVDAHRQDQMWFRIHHDTTVLLERLSFAGRTQREVRHAISRVFAKIHSPSVSGLLTYDLPGYLGLQK
jgi:hypothetical protein